MSIVIEIEGGVVTNVYSNGKVRSCYDVLDWDTIENMDIPDFIDRNRQSLPLSVIDDLDNYKNNNQLLHALDNVCEAIDTAGCLKSEVVASAMVYLKQNPDASISDALNFGLGEWVK